MVKKLILVVVVGMLLGGCVITSQNLSGKKYVPSTSRYNFVLTETYESPVLSFRKLDIKNADFRLYVILVIAFALFVRIVVNMLKTDAILQGKADAKGYNLSKIYKKKGMELFSNLFLSQERHAKLNDYFLPTILGGLELYVYPAIIVWGKWSLIAAWIVIKIALHWDRWQKSHRPPYVRFLVGNALVVLLAIYLTKFIVKI
ncbi:MAG: hypothetical protein PHS93_05165 [Candidatus Omnitrophica bacterium]|nr:hypothetical protein [Candidatus Omnitrophota bacterium]MDD5352543.1 hypothetical protein [Candidatus Omnitrophota bacterium]MDD5550141.1 hypothetical protein [Candidatus Omnitrophota bacterium]